MKVNCKTCDYVCELKGQAFINYDEMPIVLDIQLDKAATEEQAIDYVRQNFGNLDDYVDTGDEVRMYHYANVGKLSHEEPGDDDHALDIPSTGFWSFE